MKVSASESAIMTSLYSRRIRKSQQQQQQQAAYAMSHMLTSVCGCSRSTAHIDIYESCDSLCGLTVCHTYSLCRRLPPPLACRARGAKKRAMLEQRKCTCSGEVGKASRQVARSGDREGSGEVGPCGTEVGKSISYDPKPVRVLCVGPLFFACAVLNKCVHMQCSHERGLTCQRRGCVGSA